MCRKRLLEGLIVFVALLVIAAIYVSANFYWSALLDPLARTPSR
jgi:hypothetical protein